MSKKSSGGGSDEVRSTKIDAPETAAERKAAESNKGAEFSGVEATGPTPTEITAKVDPASGVVYPEKTTGGIQYGEIEGSPRMAVDPTKYPNLGATGQLGPGDDPLRQDRMPNEETPKTADGKAKILGGKRFRVTFSPPTPVGSRAALFECEAESASDALAQWRALTGFTGSTAVEPVVSEITE